MNRKLLVVAIDEADDPKVLVQLVLLGPAATVEIVSVLDDP